MTAQCCPVTAVANIIIVFAYTVYTETDQYFTKLEQQVNATAKYLGLTKSELIRKSLVDYIEKLETKSAWESGQDLFGKYASGQNDLSSNRKELLKDKFQAKRK